MTQNLWECQDLNLEILPRVFTENVQGKIPKLAPRQNIEFVNLDDDVSINFVEWIYG